MNDPTTILADVNDDALTLWNYHGRKLRPEVDMLCSAAPIPLDQYVRQIGSAKRVIAKYDALVA